MKHALVIVVAVVLIGVAVYVKAAIKPSPDVVEKVRKDFDGPAFRASHKFDLPYKRILSMIVVESHGDPSVPGKAGERGAMQMTKAALADVNKKYGSWFTWDQMLDLEMGIMAGTAYLRLLMDDYSLDLDDATRAYNAGIGNVRVNPLAGRVYLAKVKNNEKLIS